MKSSDRLKVLIIIPFFCWLLLSCRSVQVETPTGPNADLWRAAREGNAELLEQALLAGGDPMQRDQNWQTPLHLVVMSGQESAVRILVQLKKDIEARKAKRDGVAILNYLNSTGSRNYAWIGTSLPDAIQGIMNQNYSFRRLEPAQAQRKADAIIGKKTALSPELLSQLADRMDAAIFIGGSYTHDPEKKRVQIYTVVYTAGERKILFEETVPAPVGAELFDALNTVGDNIVHRLREYASGSFAIQPKNADLPRISDVNARNRKGQTPLQLAAGSNASAIMRLLIESGADYQNDLIEAINFGDDAAAVSIVRAAPDVEFRIAAGRTALIQAAFKGRLPVVRALLERKAKTDVRDLYGFTPLLYAAQEGHQEIVRTLLEAKASVNLPSWEGFTPLMAAQRKGHTAVAEMLGRAGAR